MRSLHQGPAEAESTNAAPRPSAPRAVGGRLLTGALPREILRFGLPLAVGMGLQTTFNLVDAYLLSRLPAPLAAPALGAIGVCDQLAAVGGIISYGLSVATSAFISRYQGAKELGALRETAWQSLWMVLMLGAVFGLVGAFASQWLLVEVMGIKGQVAAMGVGYLRLMLLGNVTVFLLLHLTTLQRALGSSKTPVALLIGSNALNFLLAVLLVFGPGPAPHPFAWGPPIAAALGLPRMELMGAAWATLIARTLTLIPLLLLTVWRYRLFDRKSADLPRYRSMRALWSVAWPSSTQLVVRIAAMLMLHSLVARYFTTATDQSATTALGVVFRFETMVIFVSLGWGSAAQTFVGQSLGRELPNRAQAAGWWAAGYDAATLALLALLYHAFAGSIVGWFNTTPAVTVIAVQYLQTVAYGYVGLGVGIVLGAAIQGTGATRRSLALDLLLVLVIQLPAALIAVTRPSPSLQALWMTLAGIYLVSALLYAVAYSRGRHLTFRL